MKLQVGLVRLLLASHVGLGDGVPLDLGLDEVPIVLFVGDSLLNASNVVGGVSEGRLPVLFKEVGVAVLVEGH